MSRSLVNVFHASSCPENKIKYKTSDREIVIYFLNIFFARYN
jgi:hypothetical protein